MGAVTGARRELGMAVLLCLVGALVVTVSVGRPWAAVSLPGDALLEGGRLGVPGTELVPGVRALGLVGLAGVVALAATRRGGRTAVGAVLALAGTAVVALAVRTAADLDRQVSAAERVREVLSTRAPVDGTAWPWVCAVGGLLLVGAGALVAVRGPRWVALSARYEPPAPGAAAAPASAAPPADRQLWDELDRGEDPTSR